MKKPVTVERFLERSRDIPVVDVRSPAEYAQGHITGAVNIPLFSNEERHIVGRIYTEKGRKEAIIKGFELAGVKIAEFTERASGLQRGGKLLIHCWRGGMRSGAMAWLFEQSGLECEVLEGGYKTFRRNLRMSFAKPWPLLVLGGMTGSGKTGIIRELAARGYQSLDLEGLANHKGSAFGSLGEGEQPTTEQFENNLFHELASVNPERPLWVEDESRNIGKVILPGEFFNRMRNSPVIVLNMARNLRAERLVRDYGSYSPDELIACLEHLSRRIGGDNAKRAIRGIETGNLHEVAEITLRYYDKSYLYGLSTRPAGILHHLHTGTLSEQENAALVIGYCRKKISSEELSRAGSASR